MKALLIKDFYTLLKQMRIFVILILIFAVMPGTSITAFAIVYSAMLPMTAIAYDENCKWSKLAAMMPYSVQSLVFEKYLLGYIMVAIAGAVSLASEYIQAAVRGTGAGLENLIVVAAIICVAVIMQAINLPFIYRFGVEKGRFVYLAFFMSVVGILAFFERQTDAIVGKLSQIQIGGAAIAVILILVTILLNAGSILLSVKLYKKRNMA